MDHFAQGERFTVIPQDEIRAYFESRANKPR